MKPLQLKGANLQHTWLFSFNWLPLAISKQSLDAGFAPVESKKAAAPTVTSSGQVHGNPSLSWYASEIFQSYNGFLSGKEHTLSGLIIFDIWNLSLMICIWKFNLEV